MAQENSSQAKRRPLISSEGKARLLKVGGLLLVFVAFYLFLACFSGLFFWKSDQSLLSDPELLSRSSSVGNFCGKFGFRLSNALVAGFLGLGSFVLIAWIAVCGKYLFLKKGFKPLIRSTLLFWSAALVLSTLLSFIGGIFSTDTFFGGGLGGIVGKGLSSELKNLLGITGTALLLGFCAIVWLLFANNRFARWLSTAFEKKQNSEPQPYEEVSEETSEEKPIEELHEQFSKEPSSELSPELSSEEPLDDQAKAQEEEKDNLTIVDGEDLSKPVEELKRIDIREGMENYKFPSVDLLEDYSDQIKTVSRFEVETNNSRIRTTLESYKIGVDSVTAIVGPTVTLYKVKLAPGVKSASVKSVEKDIAMALGNESVRVTILSDAVGIEVANDTRSIVPLKAMFNDPLFRDSKAELPVAIGYTITQKVKVFDLADTPHLLIAGATKMGKSVGLSVIVASLLYSKHPSELKFVFIDPKMVEFTAYKRLLKHYLASMQDGVDEDDERENVIVKNSKKADEVLRSLCIEMDDRYQLFSKAGVNKLKDYNEKYLSRHLLPTEGHRYLPYLVVVIDEYADLIMSLGPDQKAVSRGVTNSIIRLAQKGRAAGIHVIIATQRPTVDVITGLIKANFPTRIAFRVFSRTDSGTILDSPGAEKLIGRGDMLYYEGIRLERIQCAYVSTEEINAITKFIGSQDGYKQHFDHPYYLPDLPADSTDADSGAMVDMHKLDSNFEEAARLVVTYQKGSTSDIQRRLGMGYARAGKVMDQLEAAGIVGPQDGSKPRQVLVQSLDELQPILDAFLNQN